MIYPVKDAIGPISQSTKLFLAFRAGIARRDRIQLLHDAQPPKEASELASLFGRNKIKLDLVTIDKEVQT